jgi:5-hydroxyisourate hydrolase
MVGRLTTHALDQMLGAGAAGLRVVLSGPSVSEPVEVSLDSSGRATLLEVELRPGVHELVFHVADYHRAHGVVLTDPPFLDRVTITFGVAAPDAHHHVPLLLSPYGYATYRGS